jgi:predicted TIM-barrel fold metal-dependent hydrolase
MKNLLEAHDIEGDRVPERFRSVIDAHVHLFPDPLFSAIWDWFQRFAWPVRYKMGSSEIVEFLISKGCSRIVGLHYAHRPGLARELNAYMASLCARYPQLIGTATVFPGEESSREILVEAFDMGLSGVKLHAHVQYFALDSRAMQDIYEVCTAHEKPLIMHVGREPKNPDFPYRIDPYHICGAGKVEMALEAYPKLRICVPHLGADEYVAFRDLLERYDNLWLDTTMVLADYLPGERIPPLGDFRHDRVFYGSDFPNIPYAWDRELRLVDGMNLSDDFLEGLLVSNVLEFLNLPAQDFEAEHAPR